MEGIVGFTFAVLVGVFSVTVLLVKWILKFLIMSGFWFVFLYIVLVIILESTTDITPEQPAKDYLNLGLTNLNDYAYLGLYICFGISCIIFVYKSIRYIKLQISK